MRKHQPISRQDCPAQPGAPLRAPYADAYVSLLPHSEGVLLSSSAPQLRPSPSPPTPFLPTTIVPSLVAVCAGIASQGRSHSTGYRRRTSNPPSSSCSCQVDTRHSTAGFIYPGVPLDQAPSSVSNGSLRRRGPVYVSLSLSPFGPIP